jgi:hypothetical protein
MMNFAIAIAAKLSADEFFNAAAIPVVVQLGNPGRFA